MDRCEPISFGSARKLIASVTVALSFVGFFGFGLLWPATQPLQAAAGINKSLNFQGRLLDAAGAVVPDGNYNIRFKIYQDGPGNVAGNTGGTLVWTELWQNNVASGTSAPAVVKNGYFTVNLATYCAFAGGSCQGTTNTGVNFNQDTLWVSMDVGGTSTSTAPTYDGEMLPMRRLSSAVYALNAGLLGGLTSAQFLQLAQGIQTDSSTTQPSIGVNKTAGTQNLVTLQASGTDVFDVTSTGNVLLGNNADKVIQVAQAPASTAGRALTILAGDGNGSGTAGGNLVLQGGTAGSGGIGGQVIVKPQTDGIAFRVVSGGGNNALTINTATSAAGIGLGGSTVPSITYGGLEVGGALRVSGSWGGGNGDTFTTPVGSSIGTRLNLMSNTVTSFDSIAAWGISSSTAAPASTAARALVAADQRGYTSGATGTSGNYAAFAHQPTIGVLNPMETDLFGLSWEGSNTLASLKTLGADIGFNVNGGANIMRLLNGGAVAIGSVAASSSQTALLNVSGYTVAANGGNAGTVVAVYGSKGGSKTATGGGAGSGSDMVLQGGDGGDAVAGAANGAGGTILFSAGKAGSGAGTTSTNGKVIVKNQADDTRSFQVVKASSGYSILNVNTSANVVGFGDNGNVTGEIAFANSTNANEVHIKSGVTTGSNYTLTLPTALGSSGDCIKDTTGAGVLGFGACGGGGVTTVGAFSGSSQTNGATISGSTITFGPADATNPGMVTTGAQTLAGAKTFTGNTIYTGTILQKSDSASAFILQDSTGTYSNLAFDSSTGHLKVYDRSNPRTAYADIYYASGTAVFAASTGTTQIGAGTGDVTVALTNNAEKFNFTHTGTTAAGTDDFIVQRNITGGAANLSGNVLRVEDLSTTSGTKTANLLYINQSVVGTGNLILAQTGGSTTKFAVSPAGAVSIASGQSITGLGALTVDSAAATALNLGSTNATTLTLGGTTATSTLTLNAAAAGIINIGAGAQAHTVNVGTGAATQGVTLGSTSGASALVLNSGTGSISLGTSASARTISLGTAAAVQAVTVGSTNTTSSLTLQSGTGALALQSQGTITIGTNAVAQTITIGSTTAGTLRIGQNAGSLQIDGPNFDVATTGLVTLLGGLSPDLTTGVVSGAGQNLTLQPGTSTGASINGGVTTLKGGDSSGTTSVTGGALALQGGNATGASGTRTGGSVTLDAGTGASGNGAISIGGTNATGITLGSTAANNTTTINGLALVKTTSANSATAFQVQNTSGVNQLSVDTSNARVYVGPTAGDTVGTLLVIGNKTTTGDPTGVEGSMYFNSSMLQMRCFTDGTWRACNAQSSLSWGVNYSEDFVDASNGNTGADGWSQFQGGTGAAFSVSAGDTASRPGVITLGPGTTTAGFDGIWSSAQNTFYIGGGEEIEFGFKIPVLADVTNDYTIRMGLCDQTNTDCSNGVYLEYDRATSTNWRYATATGGTRTKSTSSTAVTTGWHRGRIVANAAGTSLSYYLDGVSLGTAITTNFPNTAANATEQYFGIIKKAGTTERLMLVDYFQYRGNLTTPR